MLTVVRNANAWQLILADLALILFLACAAALSAGDASGDDPQSEAPAPQAMAAAQALYRAGPDVPSLAQWLKDQPRDPRAALTIVAEHTGANNEQAWEEARAMTDAARALGVRARVIIREGETDAVYASLAYDQPAT